MGSTEKIKAQLRIIELAKQILNEKIDLATGIARLQSPLNDIGLWDKDEYIVFTAFASEIDHLPLPQYKNNWDEAAYAEKAAELKRFEEKYCEDIRAACRILIEFLESHQY